MRGSKRYSTRRHPQKTICRASVVTHTMADPQNRHAADRVSRLMVQRGIEMESGFSRGSIAFLIGPRRWNLKGIAMNRFWQADQGLCIMGLVDFGTRQDEESLHGRHHII